MNKGYKILSVVACALLTLGMTSCEKEMSGTDGHHYPILFTCDDIDTRAANIATNADLQREGFYVWCSYVTGTPDENGSIANANFFQFDGRVKYNNGVYGFEDVTEYWWVGDYTFAAMYPEPSVDNGISATFERDIQTNRLFGEIVYSNIAVQEDLLYTEALATSRNVNGVVGPTNFGGSTSVPLTFVHFLSKINVQVYSQIEARVQRVILHNISKGGTISTATNSKWVSNGETTDYAFLCNPAVEVFISGPNKDENGVPQQPATSLTGTDGILVIPGELEGFRITIETTEKEYLSGVIEANWEIGKEYTYTATLTPQNILFSTPKVAEWDHESATGSVIIK